MHFFLLSIPYVYGYVPTQPYFLSNKIAYSKLPISFNDSLRISLYFLHFIYSLGATFDIKTTVSTVLPFSHMSSLSSFPSR